MPVYVDGEEWAELSGRIRIPVGYTSDGEPIYADADAYTGEPIDGSEQYQTP